MPATLTYLKTFVIHCLIVLFPFMALAQPDLYFESLGIADGLGDLKVMSILQDQKGYMWFGTEMGGLSRFDGQQMKTFNYGPDFPERKHPGRCISALFEDEAGYLWIAGGPPMGLFRFDPEKEAVVEHYPIEGRALSAYLSAGGRIWVGHNTEGLLYLDRDSGIIKSFVEEIAPGIQKDYVWNTDHWTFWGLLV